MTLGFDDSGQGGDPTGSGRGGEPFDGGELPMSAGWVRGVGVVAIAVVVGVLLMPSATRAPLAVTTAKTTGGGTSPGTSSGTGSGTSTSTPRTTTTTTTGGVLAGASAIHVLVANGTTITHLAGGAATYLHTRGFVILTPTNSTSKVTSTQVYAASGQQVAATLVVNALGLPSNAVQPPSAVAPVASTGGATVVVIVGPDLARLASTSSTGTPG